MSTTKKVTCQRWLFLTLAAFLAPAVYGQGIIYVHAPLTSDGGAPPPGAMYLPDDYLGTQVGPNFSVMINGLNILTLTENPVSGQPTGLVAQPSSTSHIVGFQPNIIANPLDPTAFVAPLTNGVTIDQNANGFSWIGNVLGGDIFTSSVASATVGDPFLTVGYFTGLQSAYFGFQFQQGGQTYYGWMQVGCPLSGLNVGWVFDYAYETTPNTPIFAGEGAPVPEPSTWALFISGGLILSKRVLSRKG